jgi:hypothetical protein
MTRHQLALRSTIATSDSVRLEAVMAALPAEAARPIEEATGAKIAQVRKEKL